MNSGELCVNFGTMSLQEHDNGIEDTVRPWSERDSFGLGSLTRARDQLQDGRLFSSKPTNERFALEKSTDHPVPPKIRSQT